MGDLHEVPLERADEMLLEWWHDPMRLARLIRWLIVTKEVPCTAQGIADLLEHPLRWTQQYEDMQLFEGAS